MFALALGSAYLALFGCGSRSALSLGGSPPPDEVTSTGGAPSGGAPSVEEPELCVDLALSYAAEPASVMLLVDRSGSMTAPFGDGTRWSVVREALFDEQRGLVATLQGVARFGLSFYTSLDGFAGGTCPMLDQQVIELNNTETLTEAFDTTLPEPEGDTPTGEALGSALRTLLAAPAGPKYLVLLTDGEPDTCAEPDPQNGQQVSLDAAQAAFDAGVPVFTVGVSEDIQNEHLQQMANAGSGRPISALYGVDPDAAHPLRASDDPAELAAQLVGVLGDVRSCTLELDHDASELDAVGASVTLDGQKLYLRRNFRIEGSTLELLGETCDAVLSSAKELVISVPCAGRDELVRWR